MEQLFPRAEEASQAKTAQDGYVHCHSSSTSLRTHLELQIQGPLLTLLTFHWALSALEEEEIHFVTLLSKESIKTSV